MVPPDGGKAGRGAPLHRPAAVLAARLFARRVFPGLSVLSGEAGGDRRGAGRARNLTAARTEARQTSRHVLVLNKKLRSINALRPRFGAQPIRHSAARKLR